MKVCWSFLFWVAFQAGCVSNMDQFSNKVDINSVDDRNAPIVPAAANVVVTPYSQNEKSWAIETVSCINTGNQGAAGVLVFLENGFNATDLKLCDSWFMQVFLAAGYKVLAVNLPGQGRSSGIDDFYGPGSLGAVEGVIDPIASAKSMDIVGVWGYSKASIAASFYAKKSKKLKWLILGGGIYDLEKFHKGLASGAMKETLDKFHLEQGDELYETRSIAWDIENLPKNIFIYHAISDPVIPEAQAIGFRDSLAAREYNVNYIGIQESTHDLVEKTHQKVLGKIMEMIMKQP